MSFDCKLYRYSNSDFGSCLDDRRSISAHVFSLGSGVVAWSSKKQSITALSSTEAEYVAVAFVACQAIQIRGILSELQQQYNKATIIYCDNKSTIHMTKNAALLSRTNTQTRGCISSKIQSQVRCWIFNIATPKISWLMC